MRASLLSKLALLAVASLLPIAAAANIQLSPHIVLERRSFDPEERGWRLIRRAPRELVIPLKIGLVHSNAHTLEGALMDVSHPNSANYGKHWSVHDIVNHFAPSPDSVRAVLDWLSLSNVDPARTRLSRSKSWIELNATVEEVEELLKATYHVWEDDRGAERVGCDIYHIPDHLSEHIDLIVPTTSFNARLPPPPPSQSGLQKRGDINLGSPTNYSVPKTNGKTIKGGTMLGIADCNQFITPICLQTLYDISGRPNNTNKNTFGIVEFTPQAYLQSDLDLFFQYFSPSQVGQAPVLVSIDGGVAQTQNQSFNYNGESDLDLEYAMVLTNPQPILLLQTGDLVEGAGFDNWLDAVDGSFCTFDGGDDPRIDGIYPDPLPGGYKGPESCGIIKPPYVVSVSYAQDEVTVSSKSAMRQCSEYGKLGLAGSTILYSSGDFGVAGLDGNCLLPNGVASKSGKRFNPAFPATCPYVTSVGATQVKRNGTVFDPEEACQQVIFSGGGFSNIFPIPEYQKEAVSHFLKFHPPPYSSEIYNNSGRGFPDLSANGANYVVAVDGQFSLVFGTSASAPVVGAIVTLINDARISAHKSPIGFINPAIYSSPFQMAFHDIVTGGNQGCGTPGFTSTEGWDPVTGVGTPNYAVLRKLWLALP